jgi:hypothetical protein
MCWHRSGHVGSAALPDVGQISAVLSRPPAVGAEFCGLARRYRTGIEREDEAMLAILRRITQPLKARLASGKANFRPDMLVDLERAWRTQIPTAGRLSLTVKRTDGGLTIEETRVTSGEFRFAAWIGEAREPDLGLVLVSLIVRPGRVELTTPALASIGLHAVARWYQRALDVSDARLRNDLLAIARARAGILDAPQWGEFAVLATAGGKWVGQVCRRLQRNCTPEPMLGIRSFISAGV